MTADSGIWYHGSPREFTRFSLPKRYSPQEQLGFGIHFALDIEFAKMYGPVIYRCRLHPAKVFVPSNIIREGTVEDKMGKEFFRGSKFRPYYFEKGKYVVSPDVTSPKRAESILRKYGYDAVAYTARYGEPSYSQGRMTGIYVQKETPAVVMLNPAVIEIIECKRMGK